MVNTIARAFFQSGSCSARVSDLAVYLIGFPDLSGNTCDITIQTS